MSIEQTRPVIYDVIYEHGCCDVSVTTSLSATEAIFVEESKEEKKTRRQKIKTEKKNRCRQKKKSVSKYNPKRIENLKVARKTLFIC